MPYIDFRLLIAEALRREGYIVKESSAPNTACNVDLFLYKDNYRVAASCRYWENYEIDSFQVKELYEAMLRDGADAALFITSGTFTDEARRFARNQPVVLADGGALLELVNPVKDDSQFESARYLRKASLDPIY